MTYWYFMPVWTATTLEISLRCIIFLVEMVGSLLFAAFSFLRGCSECMINLFKRERRKPCQSVLGAGVPIMLVLRTQY